MFGSHCHHLQIHKIRHSLRNHSQRRFQSVALRIHRSGQWSSRLRMSPRSLYVDKKY